MATVHIFTNNFAHDYFKADSFESLFRNIAGDYASDFDVPECVSDLVDQINNVLDAHNVYDIHVLANSEATIPVGTQVPDESIDQHIYELMRVIDVSAIMQAHESVLKRI